MIIVFLSPRLYPNIGGVEKHAFEVAKLLSKKHDVTVITEGKRNEKENIVGIKVVRLNFGKKDWFKKFIIWSKLLKYRKIIEKADIIHCHDVFFWYLPLRIIYPRKKVFITFHGYETVFPPTWKAIFIRRLSEKLSSGNIAIGNYISKWYGTRSNFILYGASDGVQTRNIERKISKKIKILFIGRIEKDTGVEIYSETLKNLENFQFEVCGDGSLRKALEQYGIVHGFVKNLEKYIKRTDIIFTSSYLSIILALKHRKPVFSVYENSLKKDYLKMAPFAKWIYIANSPKVLFKKIKNIVIKKRLREKNASLAYNWASRQTWKLVSEKYLELWSK